MIKAALRRWRPCESVSKKRNIKSDGIRRRHPIFLYDTYARRHHPLGVNSTLSLPSSVSAHNSMHSTFHRAFSLFADCIRPPLFFHQLFFAVVRHQTGHGLQRFFPTSTCTMYSLSAFSWRFTSKSFRRAFPDVQNQRKPRFPLFLPSSKILLNYSKSFSQSCS